MTHQELSTILIAIQNANASTKQDLERKLREIKELLEEVLRKLP